MKTITTTTNHPTSMVLWTPLKVTAGSPVCLKPPKCCSKMEVEPGGTPFLLWDWECFQRRMMAECKDSLRNSFDCQGTGVSQMRRWWQRKGAESWEQLGSNVYLLTLWSYSAIESLYSSFSPLERPLGNQGSPSAPTDIWTSLLLAWCQEEFVLAAKCGGGPLHYRGYCVYLLALLLSVEIRASCAREERHKADFLSFPLSCWTDFCFGSNFHESVWSFDNFAKELAALWVLFIQ